MGDDNKTGRSAGSDYWAAYFGRTFGCHTAASQQQMALNFELVGTD